MWVRTQLKIGWLDLVAGAGACLVPRDRTTLQARVEAYFGEDGTNHETIAAFSVRSAFDSLIEALGLGAGDEVLFSALNVKGMIAIARRAGLTPLPLDLDIDHMAPAAAQLAKAVSPRTKVLVIAHLFGSRLDIGPLVAAAHDHGLLVVEDCAQAFNGRAYGGHADSDVVLFSFGPIKTATALGGALMRVKDGGLAARVRAVQERYPVQSNRRQLRHVAQFAALKLVTSRPILGALDRYFALRGRSYEDELADRARNVAPLGRDKQRRVRPSAGMLALLARRLTRFDPRTIEARTRRGEYLRDLIGNAVVVPAQANAHHDYWVFPILVDEPQAFIDALRAGGFDAADLPRSQAVAPPPEAEQLTPHVAAQALADMLILPCYPAMPQAALARQAEIVRATAARVGAARTRGYAKGDAAPTVHAAQ